MNDLVVAVRAADCRRLKALLLDSVSSPTAKAATTTLLKTMIDPNKPASARVRAAEIILNHAAKAIEIEDIGARVAALEQAATPLARRYVGS